MKIVEQEDMIGIRAMFDAAGRGIDYGFDRYSTCFYKYIGCGHYMYVLINEVNHQKIIDIGKQRIHPRDISALIREITEDFKVVVVDVEIGGMSVWDKRGAYNVEVRNVI